MLVAPRQVDSRTFNDYIAGSPVRMKAAVSCDVTFAICLVLSLACLPASCPAGAGAVFFMRDFPEGRPVIGVRYLRPVFDTRLHVTGASGIYDLFMQRPIGKSANLIMEFAVIVARGAYRPGGPALGYSSSGDWSSPLQRNSSPRASDRIQ